MSKITAISLLTFLGLSLFMWFSLPDFVWENGESATWFKVMFCGLPVFPALILLKWEYLDDD